jgi:phage recombination protein Bet
MSNLALLTNRLADRLGVETGSELVTTLKQTCFNSKETVTDAQMQALLIVANEYGLNPFTREIYAFPDKKNGIVPVVGVDGWTRIINSHPQANGFEFRYSENMVSLPGAESKGFEWIECMMYRKDREQPIVVREYIDEVYRAPFKGSGSSGSYEVKGPWQTHPKRFHRHKALIQAARVAFGFSGIYDQDEVERIIESPSKNMGSVEIVEDAAYIAYKAKFRALLNEAANLGSEALKAAFAGLAKSPYKTKLWEECSVSLKAVAKCADEDKAAIVVTKEEPAKAEEPAILDDEFVKDMGE